MVKLSGIGRFFYGISIAGMGFITIYYNSFPYMLLPPQQFPITGTVTLTFICGTIFIFAGVSIIFKKIDRPVSLLLGCALLLIFCFDFIPYEFMTNSNYKHLAEWENAEKEVSLAGGAFIIAGYYSEKIVSSLSGFWRKLKSFGAILFAIPIVSYGILHFQYAKEVSVMVPSWIPWHMFWTYLAGIGLLGSGIAIILHIRIGLVAGLLGAMIFIWFVTIHVPGVARSSADDLGNEMTSAFLALAYSGIAFLIAGDANKKV
jgi:uncharacterized membrane protein